MDDRKERFRKASARARGIIVSKDDQYMNLVERLRTQAAMAEIVSLSRRKAGEHDAAELWATMGKVLYEIADGFVALNGG